MSAVASREIQRHGELAFEAKAREQALSWICSHPAAFVGLTLTRAETFWLPRVPRFRWVFAVAALAALAGLASLYRRSRYAAAVLSAILAGYSAVYYIVQNTLRYEHPLWWIQVLLIGWAAHALLLRRRLGRMILREVRSWAA